MPESASGERLVDREKGLGHLAVVGQRQASSASQLAEARAGFDRELIRRQMGDPEVGQFERFATRFLGRLSPGDRR